MSATEPITVSLADVEKIETASWKPGAHHRLNVLTPQAVIPFLIVRKEHTNKLLVLSNGAVDQSKAQGRPVFQRATWSPDIQHNQIYFCDPATVGNSRLALAWGQVSRDYDVSSDAAEAVRGISKALHIHEATRRTYFGSSAGGYLSLAMLAHDAGANAIVNNAQFDWTRWFPPAVNTLRNTHFTGMTPADLRQRMKIRTNVLSALVASGNPVRVTYLINMASKHDRQIDYPMFHYFVHQHPELCSDVRIRIYSDFAAGHNPIRKEGLLPLLNGQNSEVLAQVTRPNHATPSRRA